MIQVFDVVQFSENHKWCGSLGIVTEVKETVDYIRYMVGVPIPEKGIAYIYCQEEDIEFIGLSHFQINLEEEDE